MKKKNIFNYPLQMKAFWNLIRDEINAEIKSSAKLLYSLLCDYANSYNQWSVHLYREEILQFCGFSKATYYQARQNLVEAGLIELSNGINGVKKCNFIIKKLYQEEADISSASSLEKDNLVSQNKDSNQTSASQFKDSSQYHDTTITTGIQPPNCNDGIIHHHFEEKDFTKKNQNHSKHSTKMRAVSQNKDSDKKTHLFKDSPYYDYTFFESEFLQDEAYVCFSPRLIYEEMKLASEEKGLAYPNWLITARRWAIKDKEKFSIQNSAKYGNKRQSIFGQSYEARQAERITRLQSA